MASYPDSIFSPRTIENRSGVVYDATKKTVVFAEDQNLPNAEIVAIETLLGVSGSYNFALLNHSITQHTFDGNVDFAGYKAIAMVCDNGATVPASPVAGQWYLHTPTGRKVLMQYDGSNWIPIMNVGATTIYVDKTDGTDSVNKGGMVDAGAFKTVQYAVNSLAGTISGDVTININAESYSETVTIQGKNFTGNYTITLQGTLTSLKTGTATSKIQGTGATQGSITHVGQFGSYDNKLLYITTENIYRPIDSDTADVITIVGCFTNTTNRTYTIYDWGTTIAGGAGRALYLIAQKGIVIRDISFTSAISTGVYVSDGSSLTAYNTKLTTPYYVQFSSRLLLYSSIINPVSNLSGIYSDQYSMVVLFNTKIYGASTSPGINHTTNGASIPINGSIIDNFVFGIKAVTASSALQNVASLGYVRIRNCTTGIYASNGGQVSGTTNTVYSGNTTDESAIAASYGYID